jgi:hypothetical protein
MHEHENTTCTEPGSGTACEGGLRNRFFRGKAMGAEEFRLEQTYFQERRRLVNRSLFGWGVVYGFEMDLQGEQPGSPQQTQTPGKTRAQPTLLLGAGFALDCHGRELLTTTPRHLTPADMFVINSDAKGERHEFAADQTLRPGHWLLSAHYAERGIEPTPAPGSCDCRHPEDRFQCETVVFSLRWLGECKCPCGEPDCILCGCLCADACAGGEVRRHTCLCQWASKPQGCGPAKKLCEWRGYWIDPRAPVSLACVRLDADPDDKCSPFRFTAVDDSCGPRRLVKNNNLLYDLIRGCDLTRIEWISWHLWHRREAPIPWAEFVKVFLPPTGRTECATDFTVRFSKPVKIATLTPDAFVISVIISERGTGWGDVRRVPIRRIETAPDDHYPPPGGAFPAGTTNQAQIIVDWKWYDDEIDTEESWFSDRGVTVEIEIRGDLILDCNDIAVDADTHGLAANRSGNGTPGGLFHSSFRVQPRT